MNTPDFLWVCIFSILFFLINFVHYCMKNYVRDKPLGSKSLHDIILKDVLIVTQTCGSTLCSVAILSRLEHIRSIIDEYPIILTSLCTIYISAFMSACLIHGCLCIIKILCIINLTFMEERVGETLTRALVIGIVIGINSLACILFGFHDDIKTGTPMSLLRTTSVPTGENNSFVVS